jgi:hypothetical protein
MSSLLSVYSIALFYRRWFMLRGLAGPVLDVVLECCKMNCIQYSTSPKALPTLLLCLLTRPEVITRCCLKVLGEAFPF